VRVTIEDSDPEYPGFIVEKNPPTTSAFGFEFNANLVLTWIKVFIEDFRSQKNAAAAQADVVAHSMGGDVTRTLLNLDGYAGTDSFGTGVVHKLITIGTPHLGSPLAVQLLQDSNSLMRTMLAESGLYSFRFVNWGPRWEHGGVGDLQGDGQGGLLSDALGKIKNGKSVQTAVIAGNLTATYLAFLDSPTSNAAYIRSACYGNPLAANLTSTGWPKVMGGTGESDGIVPIKSQLPVPAAYTAPGVLHSPGTRNLGFSIGIPGFRHGPPSELDPDPTGGIPAQVIRLLNERVRSDDFHPLP